MTPDKLINGLITHLSPEAVAQAKENGTLILYYAELAQKICGPQTAQPTKARRAAVVVEEETINTATEEREDVRPRPAARPATAPRAANPARNRNTGATAGTRDAVRVRPL